MNPVCIWIKDYRTNSKSTTQHDIAFYVSRTKNNPRAPLNVRLVIDGIEVVAARQIISPCDILVLGLNHCFKRYIKNIYDEVQTLFLVQLADIKGIANDIVTGIFHQCVSPLY